MKSNRTQPWSPLALGFLIGTAHFFFTLLLICWAVPLYGVVIAPWRVVVGQGAIFVLLFPTIIVFGVLPSLVLHSPIVGIVATLVIAKRRRSAALRVEGVAARHVRRSTFDLLGLALIAVTALQLAPTVRATTLQGQRVSTVGIPAAITDLVLPGSELEVLPQDAKTPVVLRITRVAPHGTEFRYDIEWTGLDVGHHDLRAFLRRKDGTDVSNLPEIGVDVRTVLGPGLVKPNHPPEHEVPHFGGYRAWMIAIGVAWAIGLVAILSMFRRKRAEDHAARARPKTLAERLRPLVESAMRGTLSSAERAQLELGLVAYWRRRLDLDDERPDAALAALRLHAEAGPLLNQLDAWLYKPGTSGTVDVAALLAPYKDLPPDAIDIELALAAGRR